MQAPSTAVARCWPNCPPSTCRDPLPAARRHYLAYLAYLAWLDCREIGLGDYPAEFFLRMADAVFRHSPGTTKSAPQLTS